MNENSDKGENPETYYDWVRCLVISLVVGVLIALVSSSWIQGSVTAAVFFIVSYFLYGAKSAQKRIENKTEALAEKIFTHVEQHIQLFEDINEETIYGLANHGANGGALFLTSQNLIFIPHSMNIQTDCLRIPLTNIEYIYAYKILGFIPRGLCVIAKDGSQHKFVCEVNEEWSRALHAIKNIKIH